VLAKLCIAEHCDNNKDNFIIIIIMTVTKFAQAANALHYLSVSCKQSVPKVSRDI